MSFTIIVGIGERKSEGKFYHSPHGTLPLLGCSYSVTTSTNNLALSCFSKSGLNITTNYQMSNVCLFVVVYMIEVHADWWKFPSTIHARHILQFIDNLSSLIAALFCLGYVSFFIGFVIVFDSDAFTNLTHRITFRLVSIMKLFNGFFDCALRTNLCFHEKNLYMFLLIAPLTRFERALMLSPPLRLCRLEGGVCTEAQCLFEKITSAALRVTTMAF